MPFFLHRAAPGNAADGDRSVRLERVEGAVLRIGRGTDAHLRLGEAAVGLAHAEIRQDAEGFLLVDRGSVTDTLLNDRPVRSARLADGDRVTIGSHVLTVRITDPSDPLFVHIARLSALEDLRSTPPRADRGGASPARGASGGAQAGRRSAPPREVDYARAYRLRRRPFLTKAVLSLALAAAALFWIAGLRTRALDGETTLLAPGGLSSAHSIHPGPARCESCHTPWRKIRDASCESCHAGPAHQGGPAAVKAGFREGSGITVPAPACGSCHTEHRPGPDLARIPDASCTACHADLEAWQREAASRGAAPASDPHASLRAARSIRSFADHPEFRPAADEAALALNHAVHLAPGLLTPEGTRTQLACADCHATTAAGEIAPVVYETHCARCHDLAFDDRLPDLSAPHGDVDAMLRYVFGTYLADRRSLAALSGRELRSLVFRRGGPGLSFDERNRRLALRVSGEILRYRCAKCHALELAAPKSAGPAGGEDGRLLTADDLARLESTDELARVEVRPPEVPETWLAGARFAHRPHLRIDGVSCESCHDAARSSRATADVLIPGRGACLPCHAGGGEPEGSVTAEAGAAEAELVEAGAADSPFRPATRCVTCHYFHQRSPAWPALPAGEPDTARGEERIAARRLP